MHSFLSNSNIICRKNLLNFIRLVFPFIYIDLRCEQFINLRILKLFKDVIQLSCLAVKHRNGLILQSKDVRLAFLQKQKNIFPKLNFLNKYKFKSKRKYKKKKYIL